MKLIVLAVFLILKSELCHGKMLLRKCCENNYYVSGKKNCVKMSEDENLSFSDISVYNKDLTQTGVLDDYFVLEPGFFSNEKVRNQSITHLRFHSGFYLLENGTIAMQIKGSHIFELRNPENYCFEYAAKLSGGVKNISVYYNSIYTGNPLFYKIGFLISSIFLLLLLATYALLPELRNLGGMILMAYAGSLMLAYVFTFTLQIATQNPTEIGCRILTYLIYYFLLSSFGWMNIMSYDIWWTFRGYAKARAVHRRGVACKFGMYALCAWGIPLAMTIALAILNEMKLPGIVKPNIPSGGCFIEGDVKLYYMYVPMLIVIIMNWMFFGMTVFNIWRLSRGTQILSAGNAAAAGTSSAHRTQKHRFIVYLKLSVVMGLSWLLEVVSSFNPEFAGWYISDTYNIFIGVIIFAIFVCKKKVYNNLRKRLSSTKAIISSSNSSTSRSRNTRSTEDSNSQSVPLNTMKMSSNPPT